MLEGVNIILSIKGFLVNHSCPMPLPGGVKLNLDGNVIGNPGMAGVGGIIHSS